MGITSMTQSSGLTPVLRSLNRYWPRLPSWVRITPLGLPVVPEVYMRFQASSASTIVDDIFHLGSSKTEHDWDSNLPSFRSRCINLHPFDGVVGQDRKSIS